MQYCGTEEDVMPRGLQRKGIERRNKLLHAAIKLFLKNGYEKTTTASIAKEAGIMRAFMARPCNMYFTIEGKIIRFLSSVFTLYSVPKEKQEAVIRGRLRTGISGPRASLFLCP